MDHRGTIKHIGWWLGKHYRATAALAGISPPKYRLHKLPYAVPWLNPGNKRVCHPQAAIRLLRKASLVKDFSYISPQSAYAICFYKPLLQKEHCMTGKKLVQVTGNGGLSSTTSKVNKLVWWVIE